MTNLERILQEMREKGWKPRTSGGSGKPSEIRKHTDPTITDEEHQEFLRFLNEDRRRYAAPAADRK